MPNNFLETPRPIINRGEEHIACAVVVDTSGSMSGYEQELVHALNEMKEAIIDDDMARGRVELCLITYDNAPRMVQPFGPMHMFEVPTDIRCNGMTSTHAAIRMALDAVKDRTAEYDAQGVARKRPWLWLLTDGGSNDADNGSYEELMDMQLNSQLNFFGVGIGPQADGSELKSMSKKHQMLRVSRQDFLEAFKLISQSMSRSSSSSSGMATLQLGQQISVETD